jgi:hypothetical protein
MVKRCLPAPLSVKYSNTTAAAATQCRSNPVSGRSLSKTGVFHMSAGDYRRFRSENAADRSLETGDQFAKGRRWRAFLRLSGPTSLSARLPGWRRSADRTRLHANSLLTGNFTGNFAIFSPLRRLSTRKAAVPQGLFAKFPKRTNREIFPGNREFFGVNREIWPQGSKRPFLTQ